MALFRSSKSDPAGSEVWSEARRSSRESQAFPVDQAARASRLGLALVAATILALAIGFTCKNIVQDRAATEQASARLTAAWAAGVEAHVDAAFRDATSAALSAARRIEETGGVQRFGAERRLHDDLSRELAQTRSTSRLVLTDASGRVLASSADDPAPPRTIERPSRLWTVTRPGGRSFLIGLPERSAFDGKLVIPCLHDIIGPDGRRAGTLRADIRVDDFRQAVLSTAEPDEASVLVLTDDGVVLLELPVDARRFGMEARKLNQVIAASGEARGNSEMAVWPDDVARFFSWRKVAGFPVTVAVGHSRDAVLMPWRQRARTRALLGALAGGGLLLLIATLVIHVGHSSTSRQQLRDVETRYWIAMERSTIGIALVSLDGRLLHANPALRAMLGYSEADIAAMPPHLLTAEADRGVRTEVMEKFARGELNTFEREKRLARKDGSEIWVHVQSTVMRDARQRPESLITHLKDISERKQAEQASRALNETLEHRVAERTSELSRANKDLEAFSYSAAHDLRGPLARLGAFVDILEEDLGDGGGPNVGKRLDSIRRQVRDMTCVIESLLTLAHTSRAALNRKAVDLDALVRAVMADVQPAADERAIEWKVGALHPVHADRALLREVLVNLLQNAVKFTRGRSPAVIEIASERTQRNGEVVVRISDNGAGFDMQYISDLFAPFRRLHKASEFEGSGIGLAIVERIVDRHGGRIRAHGEPGQGATFWVTLPSA